jgi:hypothetical protein
MEVKRGEVPLDGPLFWKGVGDGNGGGEVHTIWRIAVD